MEPQEQQQNIDANLDRIKNVVIVLSGKGGVGKSTVSVNLAYALALSGRRVGILDTDIHGPNIAKMTGTDGRRLKANENGKPTPIKVHDNFYVLTLASLLENEDDPVIWRGPMKIGLIKQFLSDIEWPELDYLIVDSPPGTGDEPLTAVQVLKKVNGAIIVSTPQDVAFLDARKTIRFAQQLNVPVLGLIENMAGFVCPHCGEKIDLFTGEGAKKAAKDFDVEIIATLPFDPAVGTCGDKGRPYVYDFAKRPGGEALQELAPKIIAKLEK